MLFLLALCAAGAILGLYFGVFRNAPQPPVKHRHGFIAVFTTPDYGGLTAPAAPAGVDGTTYERLRFEGNDDVFYWGSLRYYTTVEDSYSAGTTITSYRAAWTALQAANPEVRLFVSPIVGFDAAGTTPLLFPVNGCFQDEGGENQTHYVYTLKRTGAYPATGAGYAVDFTPSLNGAVGTKTTVNKTHAAMGRIALVQAKAAADERDSTPWSFVNNQFATQLGDGITFAANTVAGDLAVRPGTGWGNMEASYVMEDAVLRWFRWQVYALADNDATAAADYAAADPETATSDAQLLFDGTAEHGSLTGTQGIFKWDKPGYLSRTTLSDALVADNNILAHSINGDETVDAHPGARTFAFTWKATPDPAAAEWHIVDFSHISDAATDTGAGFDLAGATLTDGGTAVVATGADTVGIYDEDGDFTYTYHETDRGDTTYSYDVGAA